MKRIGISCICPTFGRPHILEESIESFLRQDFEGTKELIILNDDTNQELVFEHPEVRIINMDKRFQTLGLKYNYAFFELAQGRYVTPWEDDDIFLPHKLKYQYNMLESNNADYHKLPMAFVWNNGQIVELGKNVFFCTGMWSCELLKVTTGADVGSNARADVTIEKKLKLAARPESHIHEHHPEPEDTYYLYRWGGMGTHLSGYPGDDETKLERAQSDIMHSEKYRTGRIILEPKYHADYEGECRQFLKNYKEPVQTTLPPEELDHPEQNAATDPVKNCCPVRIPGHILTWNDDLLTVRSKENNSHYKLNSSAATIWLMCDGVITVKNIEKLLHSQYPGEKTAFADDLTKILELLKSCQLIELLERDIAFLHSFSTTCLSPVIRIGFCNFWNDFDITDNYIMQMLTPAFNVILVDLQKDDADLVFHSTFPDKKFDHQQIDRAKSFKVLMNYEKTPIDFSDCDYAFSDQLLDEGFSDRHCRLPLLNLDIGWQHYDGSEAGTDKTLKQYHPLNSFRHLYKALFDETGIAQKHYDGLKTHLPIFDPETIHSDWGNVVETTKRKKLTIGMAVYDEYDSVYFTIQAIRMYHPEIMEDVEILILDNNPDGPYAKALVDLTNNIKECRYIPERHLKSTTVKDLIFRYASGDYVLCMDSHVMIVPGAIKKLIDYLDMHPDCNDLLQGPLLYDNFSARVSTHFNPVWSGGMYGRWGTDPRGENPDNDPFEIPMQGMGVFACRKQAWLGFNPRFHGFGGEENYIHEKFRQAGRRTLCMPFLRWLHRFNRPDGFPYQNILEDRVRNYYIGNIELGLDTEAVDEHFTDVLGKKIFDRAKRDILTELTTPFTFFDAIYCINRDSRSGQWQDIQKSFNRMGILHRVRRFSTIETPESHCIGYTLSHREIIKQAQILGLKNVLIFDDELMFREDILTLLDKNINELKTKPWKIFQMSAYCEDNMLTKAHAVAYSSNAYQIILKDLPDDSDTMKDWISNHQSIDHYLQSFDERYLTFPEVSSNS